LVIGGCDLGQQFTKHNVKKCQDICAKGAFYITLLKTVCEVSLENKLPKIFYFCLNRSDSSFYDKKNTKVQSATPKNISNDTIITVKKILHTMKC
jgi:hypothetical protein